MDLETIEAARRAPRWYSNLEPWADFHTRAWESRPGRLRRLVVSELGVGVRSRRTRARNLWRLHSHMEARQSHRYGHSPGCAYQPGSLRAFEAPCSAGRRVPLEAPDGHRLTALPHS